MAQNETNRANGMSRAVDRATDSNTFERVARAGHVMSGFVHLLIAYIIIQLAFGTGGNADQSGALGAWPPNPVAGSCCGWRWSRSSRWRCGGSPRPSSAPHVTEKSGGRRRRHVPAGPREGVRPRRRLLRVRLLGIPVRERRREIERSAERRNECTPHGVRGRQDSSRGGGSRRHRDRRLPHLQGGVEELPGRPEGHPPSKLVEPPSEWSATWPRASSSRARACW